MKRSVIFPMFFLLSINLFSETGKLTSNLKLRTIPALTGDTITILPQDSQIDIIARTKFKEEIDGFYDYWLKINYSNSTGWVYAGYVQLEGKSKLSLTEDDVVIIDNNLIQASTITDKEDFTDRLGDYSRDIIYKYLQDYNYKIVKNRLGPFEENVQSFQQQSRHSNEKYNLYLTTLKSDNLIVEYYSIEDKSKSLYRLTIIIEQYNDPWDLGIGKDIKEYTRIFGIGSKEGDTYTFDVDSPDDWFGYSAVDDLILTLDDDDRVVRIEIKKKIAID